MAAMSLAALPRGAWAAETDRRLPHIVLIIGDDQGWTDYGFMGHPTVQTPRLDRLAKESVVFTHGYVAAPLCCPSLASILTGLHPHQHLVLGNEPPPKSGDRTRFYDLIEKSPTLPRQLAERGYLSLQTGKWWHGHFKRGGFTHGMTVAGRHGEAGLKIGRETLQPMWDFIATAREQNKPFFLWYAPMMPHQPHTPPARLREKYQATDKANAAYFGMIEWFDETCGALLDHLEQKGLSDNTIVIYLADNGWKQGQASPLHDGKRSPYEGGTRTPILVRWPGRVKPGVSSEPVMSVDLAPTLLRAAGLEPTQDMQGADLVELLAGKIRRDCVFGAAYEHDMKDWNDPTRTLQARWVIEGGRWKLIRGRNTTELYDLRKDPHEKTNLAKENPDAVKRLSDRLNTWLAGG